MPIRTAIIGFGLSGQVFHAPFIDTNPSYELAVIASQQENVVKATYPNVQVVSSPEAVFADKTIDLVVIGTPNQSHFTLAKQAMQSGKSVVVEKPFTVTSNEADELIDLARLQGVILSVYHNRRFDGDFLTLQKVLATGVLGDIVHYEAHFDRYRPDVHNRWRERDEGGAGVLYDLGSHLIDQAFCLFGKPRTVYAALACQRDGAKAVDYMHLVLQYDRLRVILHSGSLVRQIGPHFIVHGTKGSYVHYGFDPQEDQLKQGARPVGDDWGKAVDNRSQLTVDGDSLTFSGVVESVNGSYHRYYDGLAEAMLNGGPAPVSAKAARDVIALIELAEQSAKANRALPLTD